ncbi:ATP-binding cassette domain-containing protein [Agromyces sp. ZXT2-3]|uniref:ATP-binding cassette domain-containing protein n=1 Tax=Agromyces sp. ZXT2-3 TaxID=3461152 RepID=UPI004054A75B
MSTAFDVRVLDSVVRVDFDASVPADVRERIRGHWVDLVEEGSEPAVTLTATMERAIHSGDPAHRVVSAHTPERLAAGLVSEATLAGIAGLSGSALMLHAAAVALEDGRVVALVGPSGRGKTTASRALGRSFGYVTDETLAVYPGGEVVPYRKPLSVGTDPDAKTPLPASAEGLLGLPETPLTLEAIVVLDRRDGVEAPYVESVPLLEALDELVPQTSFLSNLPSPLRTLVSTILSTGGVRRVVYSEADTLPGIVDEILAIRSDESPHLVDVGVSTSDCDCAAKLGEDEVVVEAAPGTVYRRSEYRDALSVDDSLVVFRRNIVSVLEGLGPVLWFAASDSTARELTVAALEEMPEPPADVDPSAIVAATLDELVGADLLVRA